MGADHIFVQGGGGTVVIKLDLPLHEATAGQLTKGYLRRVNEDGSPYVEQVAALTLSAGMHREPCVDGSVCGGPHCPPLEPPTLKPPAKSASKPEWVGWAVTTHGVKPDDAEAMTKQDLIDRYDKDPEPAGPVTPNGDKPPAQ